MRGGRGVYGKLKPNLRSCNRNHFKTKKPFKKSYLHALHAPNAPRNTTSYLIKAKENHVIPTMDEFPYSPVLDSYGSMKGLLGLKLLGEDTGDINELLEGKFDYDKESDGLVCSPSNSRIIPEMLAWRIRNQDDQIAHLEQDSAVLKERVVCLEQELGFLKHRVRILELSNAIRMVGVCSCNASFA